MAHRPPHKSNPLFELDEFDEDSDEEITGITVAAIVKDQASDKEDDSNSLIAVVRYVRVKHATLSRRVRRIERLIIAIGGGVTAIGIAWEMFKTFYLEHHK